ncbi:MULTISPECIES: AraC family transcriptional regulator [Burkholderia]|jgi:AraC-like DNA-binding protein|uniref:Transcriptional regulator, AraC family n=2 Tax=Burkholderia vietnamiensis TaxID=60552 RepID=A4JNB2_BURVG|nr:MULTISPECIES: helix-turn-helix transcriptional regulator [Burkholderia]ABO57765.1 transcriptional regulator, AraC family [Burkholderia vietnamiensis G4]AFJ88768.1 Transcriptional regulator, AraC family [Burkholderia sp. KJ006]AJY04365.1 helix-turn-helix domain protein [Burkholderia vietnamiensis LMG 10929]AOK43338.1 AraC family transcriptional regulator [Burkholderia vietnamiensis]AVR12223.1 AraC family transcriptional regulator [Burkholderia vietnamiensis]
MPDPLLPAHLIASDDGPFVAAALLTQRDPRVTPSHAHARGQLVGTLSGLVSIGLDDQQWVVPAIHAVWIPPHFRHSLHSFGPIAGWSAFIAPARCASLPAAPRAIRTTPLLREAVQRAASWDGAALDAAQTRIADVILDEIAAAPAESLGLIRPQEPRLARITDALAANLADNRRLEEWAEWAGIGARTMSRRFVAETGLTFAQWRQQARLLRALEKIADGAPVTTIALDLGYDNVSAFIDMFRRATGTTPGKYPVAGSAVRGAA